MEIEAFFSFTAHEIGLIRSRYKRNLRIAAAIFRDFTLYSEHKHLL
jgi:hypothetical protein